MGRFNLDFGRYKWTTAKYSSKCSECEEVILEDDKMLWEIGTKKAYCESCGEELKPQMKQFKPNTIH